MVGLILSAGASVRWGGAPKALLPVGAERALARIARLLGEAGVTRRRVVVGAAATEIRAGTPEPIRSSLEWIEHPAWERGRTGSIQAGLAGLLEEGVVLWPVDHPFVAPPTLPRLLAAAEHDDLATWVLPEYGGRGGHPVVLKPPTLRRIAGLEPAAPLSRLLPELGVQVRRVPVDDPGVVINLNTPEEYWTARRAGLPRDLPPWTVL